MRKPLEHKKPDLQSEEIAFPISDDVYSVKFSEELLYCKILDLENKIARVISIPYTLYGINPDDEIRFKMEDSKLLFKSKIKDGNTYTYRIAIANSDIHNKHVVNRSIVISLLDKLAIPYDEMNVLIIAINAKNSNDAVELEKSLVVLQEQNIILGYDTSR